MLPETSWRGLVLWGYPSQGSRCCTLLILCFCILNTAGLQAHPEDALAAAGHADPAETSSSASNQDEILEEVRFVLFGRERQELARVHLLEDGFQLTLFNDKLATYYKVKITSDELISATAVEAEKSSQIMQQRADLVAARERLRMARREARRDRKGTRQLPPRHENGSTPSSSTTDRPQKSPSSASSSLLSPVPSSRTIGQGQAILDHFRLVGEELLQRSEQLTAIGSECQEKLKDWNRKSQQGSPLSSRLREETYQLVEQTESIEQRIQSRLKEIARCTADIQEGELRARDISEITDRIRRRLLQCEQKVDSIEALLSACSDGVDRLGEPIVLAAASEDENPVPSGLRNATASERVSAPRRASARIDEARIDEARVDDVPEMKQETGTGAKSSIERSFKDQRDRKPAGTSPNELPIQESTDAPQSETSAESREDSTRTLLVGAILGALLVLAIAQLIKRLGLP